MHKQQFLIVLLVLLVFCMFGINIFFGTVSFTPSQVWNALLGNDNESIASFIVCQSRLPQALTALWCGCGLAVSGLLLQTIFSNALADPSILGINAGSGLGVALAMLVFGGSLVAGPFSLSGFVLILFAAFVGAAIIIVLLLFLSSFMRSSVMLLIVGILISYVTGAVISLLNYTSTAEGVHSYIIWGLGNFNGVGMDHLLPFSLVMVLGLVGALALVKPLNALLLGENYATNLGINMKRTRTYLLLITGLLTAVTTAYCGPISFVGLAVPHMARLLLGTANHRGLLPITLLLGGFVALCCNFISTLPGDQGLIPLNVITPFFGVPVILYVIFFRHNYHGF